jgi:hypothetical protein
MITRKSLCREKTRREDFAGTRTTISDDLNIVEKNIENTFLEKIKKEVQNITRKNQKAAYAISTKNRFISFS